MKMIFVSIIILILLFSTLNFSGNSKPVSIFNNDSSQDFKYYTYQEMTDLLFRLKENNSEIMSLTSIGKTYENRDIWLVKISDNVTQDEEEPSILLMGAHHGNEKASYEVLIYFIQHVLDNYSKQNIDNDKDGLVNEDIIDGFDNDDDGLIDEDPSENRVKEIVNNSQIYFIPMVNPDGVEANTRKNREPNHGPFGFRKKVTSIGVDLNRNYGYKWYRYFFHPVYYSLPKIILGQNVMSQYNDSDMTYRGPYPFSENETKAVKKFVETHDINISLSYHGYMECIMYPWFYSMLPTRDEKLYISVGNNISNINKLKLVGRDYFLGYRGSIGSSEDWLYGKHGILSFCIEIANPDKLDNPMEMYKQQIGVNLYACDKAGSIYTNQKLRLEKRQILCVKEDLFNET